MSKFKDYVKTVAIPYEIPFELTESVITLVELFYNKGYDKGFEDSSVTLESVEKTQVDVESGEYE